MALTAIPVPNPALGVDWSYTVPGQWNLDVLAVTADLAPATNPTTAADSSPNLANANYIPHPFTIWGAAGPFPGSGSVSINEFGLESGGIVAIVPHTTAFDTANVTVEGWAWRKAAAGSAQRLMASGDIPVGTVDARWDWSSAAGASSWDDKMQKDNLTLVWDFVAGATATWLHLCATWDGATWTHYVNGVSTATHAGGGPDLTKVDKPLGLGGYPTHDTSGSSGWWGRLAGLAVYGTALSGAQVAAHYAARTSSANYKAAVLADSPLALWMLDEVVVHIQRSPTLLITDGTNVVGQYPSFQGSDTATVFHWAWVAAGAGSFQTAGQAVTTVAIPPLRLPAGYSIETATPDLSVLDQWSNVVLWVDQSSTFPGNVGDVTYLDGMLVPQYAHV